MKTLVVTFCLLALGLDPSRPKPAASEPSDLDAVLAAAAKHYRGAPAVKGRFIQEYTNRVLGRTLREQGQLILRPPSSVRWEYTDPEEKLFVTAGRFGWFYVPSDQVVYRLRMDDERARLLPTRFISGELELRDEFRIVEAEAAPGRRRFELEPLTRSEQFDRLYLELELPSLKVAALGVIDSLGNETVYEFVDLKRSGPVPDDLFRFEPPEGIDVLPEGD